MGYADGLHSFEHELQVISWQRTYKPIYIIYNSRRTHPIYNLLSLAGTIRSNFSRIAPSASLSILVINSLQVGIS